MLQVLQKWRVTVKFSGSEISQTLVFHDNFYSNVVRKLAEVGFEVEPRSVLIEKVV